MRKLGRRHEPFRTAPRGGRVRWLGSDARSRRRRCCRSPCSRPPGRPGSPPRGSDASAAADSADPARRHSRPGPGDPTAPASLTPPRTLTHEISGAPHQAVATASASGIPAVRPAAYQRAADGDQRRRSHVPDALAAGRRHRPGRVRPRPATATCSPTRASPAPASTARPGRPARHRADHGHRRRAVRPRRPLRPSGRADAVHPATWASSGSTPTTTAGATRQDIYDAALGSAVYLCSGRRRPRPRPGQHSAVFRYNHSQARTSTSCWRSRAVVRCRRGDLSSLAPERADEYAAARAGGTPAAGGRPVARPRHASGRRPRQLTVHDRLGERTSGPSTAAVHLASPDYRTHRRTRHSARLGGCRGSGPPDALVAADVDSSPTVIRPRCGRGTTAIGSACRRVLDRARPRPAPTDPFDSRRGAHRRRNPARPPACPSPGSAKRLTTLSGHSEIQATGSSSACPVTCRTPESTASCQAPRRALRRGAELAVAGDLGGPVGQHHVGAGATDRGQRLHDRPAPGRASRSRRPPRPSRTRR